MIDVNGPNARVAAAVAASGVKPQIKILDAEARTAAAAAAQLGCEVGAIANSLVFDCDGEPLLVMASGAHRVDTTLLAGVLGAYPDPQGQPATGAQRDRSGDRRSRTDWPSRQVADRCR